MRLDCTAIARLTVLSGHRLQADKLHCGFKQKVLVHTGPGHCVCDTSQPDNLFPPAMDTSQPDSLFPPAMDIITLRFEQHEADGLFG